MGGWIFCKFIFKLAEVMLHSLLTFYCLNVQVRNSLLSDFEKIWGLPLLDNVLIFVLYIYAVHWIVSIFFIYARVWPLFVCLVWHQFACQIILLHGCDCYWSCKCFKKIQLSFLFFMSSYFKNFFLFMLQLLNCQST